MWHHWQSPLSGGRMPMMSRTATLIGQITSIYHPLCGLLTTIYLYMTFERDVGICADEDAVSDSHFPPKRFCTRTNSVPTVALVLNREHFGWVKIAKCFKSFCLFICTLQSFTAVLIVSTVSRFHGCVSLDSSHCIDYNVQTVTRNNVHCSSNFFFIVSKTLCIQAFKI